MSYLKKLGLGETTYDKYPKVAVHGFSDQCWRGWEAIGQQVGKAASHLKLDRLVIAVECYSGVYQQEIVDALAAALDLTEVVFTERSVFKSEPELDALLAPDLGGDDPIFGFLTRLTLTDYLDQTKLDSLTGRLAGRSEGTVLVVGPGALLCCEPDVVIYADMPRWEEQMRQRAKKTANLGVSNFDLKASLKYKRSYFVDWRACDKLKRSSYDRWQFLLDTTVPDDPKMISGDAFREGLRQAVQRPFRVVPFFDPGVWGGQWMREVCDLDSNPPNYAWCFDCVPEENSLLLDFGGTSVEVPSLNLVFRHPVELLGEPVYGRFGAEFPIRFDFLDTMQGQNLSFQVHPSVDYASANFGLSYTQDESYYILDAGEDAVVYLGLKNDIDPEQMIRDLEDAQHNASKPFHDESHVACFPAKKHDHFLIPAGTCHCSGADSMVLEISHTPYIFTFKLWDWSRLDLDGRPRPINIERGKAVINWDRRESWVSANLVNRVEPVAAGEGWREERTGLYSSEFIETRRHWFCSKVRHDTELKSVHVLNLVEGAEVIVESPSSAFEPFVIHYAETFIIPAAVGDYTIRPHGPSEGKECATLKAFIRVNP